MHDNEDACVCVISKPCRMYFIMQDISLYNNKERYDECSVTIYSHTTMRK